MAVRAGEATARTARETWRLLQPRPGRLEFALRLALIAALTTLVIQIYQTFLPALAAYIVLFLNKPDRTTSVLLNVGALVAVSVLVALLFPLVIAVVDRPVWRLAGMSALSLGVLWLASTRGAQEGGGIIALILAFGLSLTGLIPVGEAATRALLYAWLMVATPALVSLVVNLLIAPSPRRQAERALAWRLQLAARVLDGADENTRRTFRDARDDGDAQIRQWLKLAALEHGEPADDLAALRRATGSTTAIIGCVDAITTAPEPTLPANLRQRAANTLREMAGILDKGGYPVEVDARLTGADDPAVAPRTDATLAELEAALSGYAEPVADASDAGRADSATPAPAAGATPAARPMSDPAHLHYALKTTAAAMFCYLLYTMLDWPGIHTAMITCYIVALATAAQTAQKIVLRITGAVIGGILGMLAIVFLIPSMDSIMPLLALVFAGMLLSSWIAVGDERISYAGFQIGFAFLLCVLQGWWPEYDLSVARDRVIGVLLGNVVVYLVFTRIWPVSIASRIDPAIAGVLRHLHGLLGGAGRNARLASLAGVHSGLGELERDMDLLRYEPARIRPASGWIGARREILARLGALQRALFPAPQEHAVPDTGQRFERLATRFEHTPDPGELPASDTPDTGEATRAPSPDASIATQLARIEALATSTSAPERIPDDALPE